MRDVVLCYLVWEPCQPWSLLLYCISTCWVHGRKQQSGADPAFWERGGAKLFYEFISLMWHCNGRIFMLLSFPEFLIRNFFVFDIFNACVLYPSKNSYDNLSKKWGVSDAHPPKSASDSHLGWYIPLDTTLQATTLVISNKNYQQPKHKHNHEKLKTVSWKRGETETEPNIYQVRLCAHNPF